MKLFFFLTLLFLFGCKVGPQYTVPEVFMPEVFIEQKESEETSLANEDLVHWWQNTFQDPLLNQLLEEALLFNFDLKIALQQVYQARAYYQMQFSSLFPDFISDFQATRFYTSRSFRSQKQTPITLTSSRLQNFFQIGLDAIWQIDLFGKLQRSAASALDNFEASLEEKRGVKLTVLSEVAHLYILICYFQEKIALSKQLLEFDEALFNLTKERFEAGLASEDEIETALASLESNQANQKMLEAALKQNIYALATLLGRHPPSVLCLFEDPHPIPSSFVKIPKTLPLDLLRQRPDIAAAERQLAAQTELIGVAVADLFPSISLVGSSSSFAANPLQGANVGLSSDTFNQLFTPSSRLWGIGALITWPIFDFGKRAANVDIQTLITNQAYLNYEKTVLIALQEMETALVTYFKEEEKMTYLKKQHLADQRYLNLISDQFQAGLVSLTEVLQAKEKWLISKNLLTDSQQTLSTHLVSLYKTIGGDW